MKGDNLSRKVTPDVISKLQEIVGPATVNTNEMDRLLYSHDLAPLPKEAGLAFKNIPDVIVRPSTTEEVAAIVKLAYETGVAITPRGSSTWGLGGSMPTAGGILLDMSSKMNKVVAVDTVNMCIKVQGGCTWKNAMDACEKEGYILGSYPSSFPSATVAAWLSTGGVGICGYKYGNARDSCLNIQVVLSDGSVIETGFDLTCNNGGSSDAFVKYVQDNLVYPQVAIDNGESGRVVVNFIVDANGKIKNAKVVTSVSNALDAEALRVVNAAPDWTPAKVGGKAVPVAYSVPVVFALR